MDIKMMTYEEQEQARAERLAEQGNEPPCPFCHLPRVKRETYIRCNPCGTNWLNEESKLPNYLNRDPGAARSEYARSMRPIVGSSASDDSPAKSASTPTSKVD